MIAGRATVRATIFVATLIAGGCTGGNKAIGNGIENEDSSRLDSHQSNSSPAPMDLQTSTQKFAQPNDYLCTSSQTLKCNDANPLIATSLTEAQWLLEHGYPTSHAISAYENVPTLSLEKKPEKTPLDRLILAERYAKESRHDHALEQAFPVVQSGNIYGLYVMHDIMSTPGPGGNKIDAGAYLKMAYILGDHKAALQFNELYGALSPAEVLRMEERASLLTERLGLARRTGRPME